MVFRIDPVVFQLLIFPIRLHSVEGSCYGCLDVLIARRLQNVVEATQLDRLFGIKEVGVRGEKYAYQIHTLAPGPAEEREAVLAGHFNVAQHSIYLLLGKDFFSLGDIPGGTDSVYPQRIPVNAGDQSA